MQFSPLKTPNNNSLNRMMNNNENRCEWPSNVPRSSNVNSFNNTNNSNNFSNK